METLQDGITTTILQDGNTMENGMKKKILNLAIMMMALKPWIQLLIMRPTI